MIELVHRASSCAFLSALCVCVIAGCGDGLPERPNVVLVVVDSLRADALSFDGYERLTSPRLDAFARANLVFDDAVTVAASTAPAMAALMSGRLPYYEEGSLWTTRISFGLHRFFGSGRESGLPLALDSLAERLQGGGYATGGFVTNGHLKAAFQFDQGFDVFEEMLVPHTPQSDELPYGPAEELTRRGIEWLDTTRDTPFFLYLHYMDVHYPYLPPAEDRQAFDFQRVPEASDFSIQEPWLTEFELDAPRHRNIGLHMRGLYDAEVRHTDHWIGVLLDHLESRGLHDRTLVVVTSDHGEEFLEHGGTIHKGKLYEELLRVPLLMRIPGRGPARLAATVRNFDVMPTILDYCGIDLPAGLDARSLRSLIEREPGDEVPTAIASFPTLPGRDPARMIRTKRYKYVHVVSQPERSELYDLEQDPGERKNLYSERSELARSLHDQLEAAFAKLAREAGESDFDFRLLQSGADAEHDERLREALERMSPEEQTRLLGEGLSRMSPDERARLHEGLDAESAEQLRAIGYLD